MRLLHSLNFSDILLTDLLKGFFSLKLHGNSFIKFLLTIHLDFVSFSSSLGSNSLVFSDFRSNALSNSGFFLYDGSLNLDFLGSLDEKGLFLLKFFLHD